MAFQFFHIQSHARTRSKKASAGATLSVRDIIAEATRETEHCKHIESPQAPTVLLGDPSTIEDRIEARCLEAKAFNCRGQAIRRDQRVMVSYVASFPPDLTGEALAKAQHDAIEFMQAEANRNGMDLDTVVRHDDEPHVHLHGYALARPESAMKADLGHPGKAAKKAAEAAGVDCRVANSSYREAMRGLQDRYYAAVGMPNGMLRLGPGRRRLTADAYKSEKENAKRLAETMTHLDASVAKAAHAPRAIETAVSAVVEGHLVGLREDKRGWSLDWRRGTPKDYTAMFMNAVRPAATLALRAAQAVLKLLTATREAQARAKAELEAKAVELENRQRAIEARGGEVDQTFEKATELLARATELNDIHKIFSYRIKKDRAVSIPIPGPVPGGTPEEKRAMIDRAYGDLNRGIGEYYQGISTPPAQVCTKTIWRSPALIL